MIILKGEFMPITDILNFYEDVKDDLKFHSISAVRIKIMISLSEGPKKTKELRELTSMQSSTILHGITELEKQDLIIKEGDNFYLSEIGKIMVLKLEDMIKTSISLKKFQKLWLNHEIDAIPQNLLMNIGDLSNSELIESDNIDVFKPHGTYIQMLIQSKEIKGLSPIFYKDYIKIFDGMINKGTKIELILTNAILEKLIESLDPESLKNLNNLLSGKRLKIWELEEDIKIAFTITDKFLSLGLFIEKGTYDITKNLISKHDDAIAWGNKLFEYYRNQAKEFDYKKNKN